MLTDTIALGVAAIWPMAIWGIVEIAKEFPLSKQAILILPLALGALTGPIGVHIMVECVDGVEAFPAVHSVVVGLGAGSFASYMYRIKHPDMDSRCSEAKEKQT